MVTLHMMRRVNRGLKILWLLDLHRFTMFCTLLYSLEKKDKKVMPAGISHIFLVFIFSAYHHKYHYFFKYLEIILRLCCPLLFGDVDMIKTAEFQISIRKRWKGESIQFNFSTVLFTNSPKS